MMAKKSFGGSQGILGVRLFCAKTVTGMSKIL